MHSTEYALSVHCAPRAAQAPWGWRALHPPGSASAAAAPDPSRCCGWAPPRPLLPGCASCIRQSLPPHAVLAVHAVVTRRRLGHLCVRVSVSGTQRVAASGLGERRAEEWGAPGGSSGDVMGVQGRQQAARLLL